MCLSTIGRRRRDSNDSVCCIARTFCNFAPMGENILEVLRDLGDEGFSIEHLEQEGIDRVSQWSLQQA